MNIGRLPSVLYDSFPFPHLSPLYGAPGSLFTETRLMLSEYMLVLCRYSTYYCYYLLLVRSRADYLFLPMAIRLLGQDKIQRRVGGSFLVRGTWQSILLGSSTSSPPSMGWCLIRVRHVAFG